MLISLTVYECLIIAASSVDWQSTINTLYSEKIESIKEYQKAILTLMGALLIAVMTAWWKDEIKSYSEIVIPAVFLVIWLMIVALYALHDCFKRLHEEHRLVTTFLAFLKR
jgi:hypothetical protein